MKESKPHTQDLLPVLAKVARGSSVLFWGLPITLIVAIMSSMSNWTDAAFPLGMLLPPVAFGMLWYGLRLLMGFSPRNEYGKTHFS